MSEAPSNQGGEAERWIEAARAGLPDGLDRIAQTYRNYLLLIANQQIDRDLQGKIGASDIVQETLVQMHCNFDQFRGRSEAELMGWLKRILQNQLADAARRYRQTEKRDVAREQRIAASESSTGVEFAGRERSPRAEIIAREESRQLAQALDRLPEEYRQVILLRNWDRRSFAEIGKEMNRSEAAAGKLWARAIERLQQELEAGDEK